MGGIDLPRGRFTDALVASGVFAGLLLASVVGLDIAAMQFGFIPQDFLAGGWRDDALRSWLSPLASMFIPHDILSGVFNLVFLLIAGRFVERAIRPVGLGIVLVAGAYAGALARLILTPGSTMPSGGLDPAVFAVIGAYFMLYGVPAAIPVGHGQSRAVQVAMLAGVWFGIQAVFAFVAQNFELSVTFVEPIGGLIAGVLLARPLLRWQYRRA